VACSPSVMAFRSATRAAKRQRWAPAGPSNKQLRLSEFAVMRCSESSLVSIVDALKRQPALLEEISASPLAEASQAMLAHLSRGPIPARMEDGSFFDWVAADLDLVLPFLAKHSEGFRDTLAACRRDRGCGPGSPWEVVLYNDEAVPGAALRLDNRRRVACFYATVKTRGPKVVVHEAAWVPIAFLRHDVLQCAKGRFSAVMRLLVGRAFTSVANSRTEWSSTVWARAVPPLCCCFSDWDSLCGESACHLAFSAKGHPGCSLAYVARTFMAAWARNSMTH